MERVGACVYKGKKIARWWMRRRCPIQDDDDWAFAYSSALIAVEYASVPLESLLRPFCKRYEHSCLCATWLGSKKRVGLGDHVPCKTQDLRWLLRDVLMYQAPFADSHEGFLPTFFVTEMDKLMAHIPASSHPIHPFPGTHTVSREQPAHLLLADKRQALLPSYHALASCAFVRIHTVEPHPFLLLAAASPAGLRSCRTDHTQIGRHQWW